MNYTFTNGEIIQRISCRIPLRVWEATKRLATKENTTRTALVTEALVNLLQERGQNEHHSTEV